MPGGASAGAVVPSEVSELLSIEASNMQPPLALFVMDQIDRQFCEDEALHKGGVPYLYLLVSILLL